MGDPRVPRPCCTLLTSLGGGLARGLVVVNLKLARFYKIEP